MPEKRSTPHKVTGAGERIEQVETQITYKCQVRPDIRVLYFCRIFILLYQDTQQVLLPTEIKSAFDYGGTQVVFSREEINKMRSVKGKGIHSG